MAHICFSVLCVSDEHVNDTTQTCLHTLCHCVYITTKDIYIYYIHIHDREKQFDIKANIIVQEK